MADGGHLPPFDSTTGDITPVRVLVSELKNAATSMLQEQQLLRAAHEELAVQSGTVAKELANSRLQASHVRVVWCDVITVLLFMSH